MSFGIGGANDSSTVTEPNEVESAAIYIYRRTSALNIEWERMVCTHRCDKHTPLIKVQMKQLCIEEYNSKEPHIGKLEGYRT